MRKLFLNVTAVAMVAGFAAAQEPQPPAPLARAELDKRARKVAYEAVDLGVAVFNAGERSANPLVNYEGTARLYEGTLMALIQMLDHRPDTVKMIQTKLEASKLQIKPQDWAFVLREAADEVMKVGAKKIALWDRLGGEKSVAAVVKEFVAKTAANPKVDFTRGGKYKPDAAGVTRRIEKTLVELISATTGGPLAYSGKDMKAVHTGMMITEAEFTAMAGDLVDVLVKFNVPPAEIKELIAIVASTKPLIVEGKAPLWERLGGEPAVKAVAKEFIAASLKNPKVNFLRDGKFKGDGTWVAEQERLLVEFLSSLTGGPLKYTGRDMKAVHAGMKVTEDEFAAMASDLIATLQKLKVPKAEMDELVGIVASTKPLIVEGKK